MTEEQTQLDYSLNGFIPLIYDPNAWILPQGYWFVWTWNNNFGYIMPSK